MEGTLSRRTRQRPAERPAPLCAAAAVLALLMPAAAAAAPGAAPAFVEVLATRQHLQSLRAGGYALFIRHGQTFDGIPDHLPGLDPDDCAHQRPLNEVGRRTLVEVGAALRRARIPLGEVLVSPMCRTRHSAEMLVGGGYRVESGLMHLASMTPGEKDKVVATTRRLLAAPVAAGGNRILVAHAANLSELIGYYPQEAVLVIFRPGGDGRFEYVASIPPARWKALQR